MRLCLTVLLLAGCSDDACGLDQTAMGRITLAAPGDFATTEIKRCSTCGHSKVIGVWDPPPGATGTVKVALQAGCFVRASEISVDVSAGTATIDGNSRNCGDIIGYTAYVTNNSNMTVAYINAELHCPLP
jgi:hypothetical protein